MSRNVLNMRDPRQLGVATPFSAFSTPELESLLADMHDTMENIDLDYGSAVCAITIESVARVARLTEP